MQCFQNYSNYSWFATELLMWVIQWLHFVIAIYTESEFPHWTCFCIFISAHSLLIWLDCFSSGKMLYIHCFFSGNKSDFECTTPHCLPLVVESWPATAACCLRCPGTLPGPGCLSHGSPDTNHPVSAHWTPLPAPGSWGNHWQREVRPMNGLVTTIKNRWTELTGCPIE